MIKQSLERLSQRIQKETFQKDNKLLYMLENNMNASQFFQSTMDG